MKKILIMIFLPLVALSIKNSRLHAAELNMYDFQVETGEGTLELYRVMVDTAKEKGNLCFLHTERSSVPDEVVNKLRTGIKWSNLIDMHKYDHACFKFDIYGPAVWFFSPLVKYSEAEYMFFFVGEINPRKMQGTIYRFRNFLPKDESSSYKSTRVMSIEAEGIVKPK